MPKSNFLRKKSKSGSSDFKRLKAKVGKRAPQAANYTDTSFRSKRVKVTAQSILDEAGESNTVTARGQGVQELLVQLRHYNPTSKREALLGLKSIVDRYPKFAEFNFGRLAEESLELAVCVDNDVRKCLLDYQEALLRRVSMQTFVPFANLYMAFVSSAMSSLDRSIRSDSIALLELLLAHFPNAVADRAGRVVPNYPMLLATDPASKHQKARREALKSLVSLFRAISRRPSSGRIDGRIDAVAGDSRAISNAARLRWKKGSRRNSALVLVSCATPSNASEGSGGDVAGDVAADALGSILPQVLERLRDVWMEAIAALPLDIELLQRVTDVLREIVASPAWSTFAGNSRETRNETRSGKTTLGSWRGNAEVHKVGGGSHGQGAVSGSATCARFAQFVPLVLESFPIQPHEGEMLGDEESHRLRAIGELNMGLCELLVAASIKNGSATVAPTSGVRVKGEGKESNDTAEWLMPVLAHMQKVLRRSVHDDADGTQAASILRVLGAAMYRVEGKKSASWMEQRQRLLSSFGDFFVSLSPRVEANFLCVNFICNLTLKFLSGSTVGGRRTDVESETACEICRWLQVLPQLLCQWGGDFPENSAYVLQVLVEVAKRAPAPPSVCTSDRTGGVSSSNKGPVKTVGGVAAGGVSPSNRKGVIDSGGKGPGKYVTGSGAGAKSAISGTVSTPSAATAAARLPGSREGAIGGWAVESLELLNSIRPAVLREFFSEGAFLALPIEAQMDAISLLYHVPSISNGVLSALAAACSRLTAIHSDIRSFILEVVHHRRRSLTPSAYLGFLVSILTGAVGGSAKQLVGLKRTPESRLEVDHNGNRVTGKRRRQQAAAVERVSKHLYEEAPPLPLERPSMWETAFARDEVTGAVCNSLAMLGTRGGALLSALCPTLEKLLRGCRTAVSTAEEGEGALGVSNEEDLAEALQRQRAAMACVLCCWEGLNGDSPLPLSTNTSGTGAPANSTSPLSALEKPMALACIQAMKIAGRVDGADEARRARLLRPVLVLIKRWHSLLPIILETIMAEAAATATSRTAEPLIRCLRHVVGDAWLREHLRRRHLSTLRETSETLCKSVYGSPLQELVIQLSADVDLLGGGRSQMAWQGGIDKD